MKRTLMFENRELLDFEVEPVAGKARVLGAPYLSDEELVRGYRLHAMCGMRREEADGFARSSSLQPMADAFSRVGLEGHGAHVAKIAAFKNLSLLGDIHSGNYGVICNAKTGERRFAPPFDYGRSFGFPNDDRA